MVAQILTHYVGIARSHLFAHGLGTKDEFVQQLPENMKSRGRSKRHSEESM